MKRIIFTGKGGVGKTTILSTVARLLSREGHRVLVVDCDPSMNLAMSMGIHIAQVTALAEDRSQSDCDGHCAPRRLRLPVLSYLSGQVPDKSPYRQLRGV